MSRCELDGGNSCNRWLAVAAASRLAAQTPAANEWGAPCWTSTCISARDRGGESPYTSTGPA